jgi:hypothetical protein
MKNFAAFTTCLIVFAFILIGCSVNPTSGGQYTQNISKAEVIFNVTLPANSNGQSGLFLEVVDEITGLGLNPIRYQMQSSDGFSYSLRMSFPLGFLLKYRYVQEGNPPLIEFDAKNNQIRYRLAIINSPLILNDSISGWQNLPFNGMTGILQGFIFNANTSEPVANAMVVINGMRTFTDADGSYTIANIPVGEHFLSTIHVDGSYQPFQQKAIIAANAVTPANFGMKPSKMVNITFLVTPPAENLAGAPIRFFGDQLSLGNTFYDKSGGITTDVAYGRTLMYQDDGNYALTLLLPAGNPLEYKYSLGDGFWNAERDSDKRFRIRKIIVPSEDTTIHDVIATWKNTDDSTVTFHISTPADTPASAAAFIQLNPFVWMEPLPLWNLGNNQWLYVLYSPMEFVKSSNYRILLNDTGKMKIDIIVSNPTSIGIKIDPLISDISYSVSQWANK